MAEDFSAKVALVTGGGNGIGAATCRAFAVAGARVVVLDRDAAAAERVAAEITGRNGKAEAYGLDVSDREGFARLAAGITEATGSIDILVNGAGVTVRRMIGEMGAEDWDQVIAVNLTSTFNGIRGVAPYAGARRRRHRQHRLDRRAADLVWWNRELFGVEGGALRVDPSCRLRAFPRSDPGQCRLPRRYGDSVRRSDADRGEQG